MNKLLKSILVLGMITSTSLIFGADQQVFTAKATGFWSQYCPFDYSCSTNELTEDLLNKCYAKGYRDCTVIQANKTQKNGFDVFCGRDAIRSLAGEEPTDRLVETISILRESSDELAMYSDEEMEMLIVEAVAI